MSKQTTISDLENEQLQYAGYVGSRVSSFLINEMGMQTYLSYHYDSISDNVELRISCRPIVPPIFKSAQLTEKLKELEEKK